MAEQKTRWVDDIIHALEDSGGEASLEELYERIQAIRSQPLPATWDGTVRYTLQHHSSDSSIYRPGTADLFYSVEGLGKGTWGLRDFTNVIPVSQDLQESDREMFQAERKNQVVSRIVRDTRLTLLVKSLHGFKCQICAQTLSLRNGKHYAEAHHLKPLGRPHNGPDVIANILCVCPNHHAALDYGAIQLDLSQLHHHPEHELGDEYINYHNRVIYGREELG